MRALAARLPTLELARVDLGVRETPLERWRVDGASLLAKRDDLSAEPLGGNKVRALELLLAGVQPGDRVLTVGATGSTHALAVARHATRLGARPEVITWPQEAHAVASATRAAMRAEARVTDASSAAAAYLRALVRRLRGDVRWIPAGGSSALGAIGHVDAALELAGQLAREGLATPRALVVPLGSGGTAAGLLVGLALAGLAVPVVAVQVVPSLVANRVHVLGLARQARALLARRSGVRLPSLDPRLLSIDRSVYGGAYGRETAATRAAEAALRAGGGPRVEPTYSAKALAVALRLARTSPANGVLFWLTFDGRWLGTE